MTCQVSPMRTPIKEGASHERRDFFGNPIVGMDEMTSKQ